MADSEQDERARVAYAVSGMVAGGYAVDFDLAEGEVPCSRCGVTLGANDDVTAEVANYEGHTWELYAVYCADHGVETVDGDSADEEAIVAATLEPTGYRDPDGSLHPNAVTLGGIDVLDYSPMGYE